MTYGQYSLNNSLNYKRFNTFTGNNAGVNNLDLKKLQDAANQSSETAKQNLQQNNMGGIAVDTFEGVKDSPLKMAAYGAGGLALSGGLGVAYTQLTASKGSYTETAWHKIFNGLSQNSLVKKADEAIISVGNFIKDKTPKFLKEGEIANKFNHALTNYKSSQGQIIEINQELIKKLKDSGEEAAKKANLGELFVKLKDVEVEKLSKADILKHAGEIASKIAPTTVDDSLKGLKGLANRVHLTNTIGIENTVLKSPIAKSLSDTSMFVSKMFGGSKLGIVLNAIFMGQTIKAVADAKPEDRHKVLAEEVAGTWIGNMLLLVPLEKAFNAVMGFRHIGLDNKNLAEMTNLEHLIKGSKDAEVKKLLNTARGAIKKAGNGKIDDGVKKLFNEAAKQTGTEKAKTLEKIVEFAKSKNIGEDAVKALSEAIQHTGLERKALLAKISEVAKTAAPKGLLENGLKLLGKVLSIGVNSKGPLKWFGATARVIILWFGMGSLVSEGCKKIANMITGAPTKKEEPKKAENKIDKKVVVDQSAKKLENVVNQSKSVPPQAAVPVQQNSDVHQEIKEKSEQVESEYVPSAVRLPEAKKASQSFSSSLTGSNASVDSAMTKSDALLKKAENLLKHH